MIDIHDPRTMDVSDFSPGDAWSPAFKNYLVITCTDRSKVEDVNFLHALLSSFQSDRCFLHVSPLRRKRLKLIEAFFETESQAERDFFLTTGNSAKEINKFVQGYAELCGWHEWIFGLYSANRSKDVELFKFDRRNAMSQFVTSYALFEEIIYFNLDTSYLMLFVRDRSKYDEAIKLVLAHCEK